MEIGKFKLMIGTFGTLCIIANGIHEPIEIHATLPSPAQIIDRALEVAEYISDKTENSNKPEDAAEPSVPERPEYNEQTVYRIRDMYNTPSSQKGAYKIFELAQAMCPTEFCIFDQNGNLYYAG